MNDNLKCEFCNKIFSSKSNLLTHITKAKYCIKKRNGGIETNTTVERNPQMIERHKNPSGVRDTVNYTCSHCEKSFTSKQFLHIHISKCNKKTIKEIESMFQSKLQDKDYIIENLQKQVNYLQKQLANVALVGASKSTKITNNTTNNTTNNVTQILSPFDLDQKDILCIIEEKLDENSFLNSQRGIAKFCVDNILKTEDGKMRMICTDPSRERFKYMDENGVIKEDIQARQFIEKIYPPIHKIGEKIHENILEKCKTQHIKIASGEDDTEKYMVKVREEAAHNSWTDIRFMKSRTSNGTFRKELAILSNV